MKLIAFDLETTGIDPLEDRIVEVTLTRFEPCDQTEANAWARFKAQGAFSARYNPGRTIPSGATAHHGIRDEDVADSPPFTQDAGMVQEWIKGAVLVGYNSRSFDTIMLDAELRRSGQEGLNLKTIQEIDVYRLWSALEPRTLTGALYRFQKERLEDAHTADADVAATIKVLDGIMGVHGTSLEDAIGFSIPEGEVDRGGKLALDDEGDLVFNFGKHKGEKCRTNVSYIKWMKTANFPEETLQVLREAYVNDWVHAP